MKKKYWNLLTISLRLYMQQHSLITNAPIMPICKPSKTIEKFRERLWNTKIDFVRSSNSIGELKKWMEGDQLNVEVVACNVYPNDFNSQQYSRSLYEIKTFPVNAKFSALSVEHTQNPKSLLYKFSAA